MWVCVPLFDWCVVRVDPVSLTDGSIYVIGSLADIHKDKHRDSQTVQTRQADRRTHIHAASPGRYTDSWTD